VAHVKQDLLLFTSEKFQLAFANLVNIFKALGNLKQLLQGTNKNRINVCGAMHSFMAKLELWHPEFKKEMQFHFPT